MLDAYKRHNLFWASDKNFFNNDPHLKALKGLKKVYPLERRIDFHWDHPGIYIVTGGRQIGKTTTTKLLIQACLKKKTILPASIFYLPCDQVVDDIQLVRILRFFLDALPQRKTFFIVLDEVTFVKNWQKAVKVLADEGWFGQGLCLVTGSDSVLLKDAAQSFPGRRGQAEKADFHLYPLSFFEYVEHLNPVIFKAPEKKLKDIYALFEDYLKTGGYLRAINDYLQHGRVLASTYAVYEQWVRGDFLRKGKSERFLQQLLLSLLETGPSQISFSSLASRCDLNKTTLIEYYDLLVRMDVCFDLMAFDQNKRRGFPKKARKFHFLDPFIEQSLYNWLKTAGMITAPVTASHRIESCVAAHFFRRNPVYYIKAAGEVDLVILKEKGFVPVEVKWSRQIRQHDLRQLTKYKDAVMLTKGMQTEAKDNISHVPLPLYLLQFA